MKEQSKLDRIIESKGSFLCKLSSMEAAKVGFLHAIEVLEKTLDEEAESLGQDGAWGFSWALKTLKKHAGVEE